MENKKQSSCLKPFAVILIIALVIYGINSGFFKRIFNPDSKEENKVKTNKYIDSYQGFIMDRSVHSYDSLSNNIQRKMYKQFESCVGDITEEKSEEIYKTSSFELSGSDYSDDFWDKDLDTAYEAFYSDNPQVFWLCGYDFSIDKEKKVKTIWLKSRYDADTVRRMKSDLNDDINKFYRSVPTNLTGYYLEKYVHDYLNSICRYNKDIASVRGDNSSDEIRRKNPEIATAYGAIHNGDAVCNGYAQAFELLCKCVGLDCVYIVGGAGTNSMSWAESTLHAWNAVCLSGKWYMVDTTWDDNDDPAIAYHYFNITTHQLSEDHSAIRMKDGQIILRGRENVFLPECTDSFYNYYVYDKDCVRVKNIKDNSIGQAMINALNSGSKMLFMYLDPNYINYKSAKKLLFESGSSNYMNRYLKYVTDHSSYSYSNYTYWTLESRNAIILQLNY
ncbi:MAG: hypothetical protein IJ639_12160 [Ruminococcus sp.]|nr:hypothetical protein [Ruminococcus sp.]